MKYEREVCVSQLVFYNPNSQCSSLVVFLLPHISEVGFPPPLTETFASPLFKLYFTCSVHE